MLCSLEILITGNVPMIISRFKSKVTNTIIKIVCGPRQKPLGRNKQKPISWQFTSLILKKQFMAKLST
jgi:hypothetical protein